MLLQRDADEELGFELESSIDFGCGTMDPPPLVLGTLAGVPRLVGAYSDKGQVLEGKGARATDVAPNLFGNETEDDCLSDLPTMHQRTRQIVEAITAGADAMNATLNS